MPYYSGFSWTRWRWEYQYLPCLFYAEFISVSFFYLLQTFKTSVLIFSNSSFITTNFCILEWLILNPSLISVPFLGVIKPISFRCWLQFQGFRNNSGDFLDALFSSVISIFQDKILPTKTILIYICLKFLMQFLNEFYRFTCSAS
jgi:hypothetical protein